MANERSEPFDSEEMIAFYRNQQLDAKPARMVPSHLELSKTQIRRRERRLKKKQARSDRRCGDPAAPPRQSMRIASDLTLDPIEPDLIHCIRGDRIIATRRSVLGDWGAPVNYWWGEDGFNPTKREGPDEGVYVSAEGPFARRFSDELIDIGLLCPLDEETRIHAACGLFGVHKTESTLRVIFDARPANAKLTPIETSLNLFTLDNLVQSWAAMGHRGDVHIINVDYRHYYYQLKIPAWLIPYVVVTIDGKNYYPAALPMGFRDACTIAQVVTWCIVLHRESGESALGVPEEVVRGHNMPPFIPLDDGGAIFVLLDGVFIMNTSPKRHAQWKKRLERNEALFQVRRKVGHDFALTPEGRTPCRCDKPNCNADEAATFVGVCFESTNQLRPAKELVSSAASKDTWRTVSSRLGRLLWHLRVLGAGRLATDNPYSLLHHEELLQLWTRVGTTGSASGWDQAAEVDLGALSCVEAETAGRRHHRSDVSRPQCRECILRARIFAVDATPTKTAWVEYQRFSPDGPLYMCRATSSSERERASQAAMELRAALNAASLGRGPTPSRCPCCGNPPTVIIGGDADGVRAALKKGYSGSQVFRELMFPLFSEGSVRIEIVRIPGKMNVADGFSRDWKRPFVEGMFVREERESARILEDAVAFLLARCQQ
jgi:hypothetical protein